MSHYLRIYFQINYPNFNNHEISTIVAYSISEKSCEIARQPFYEEFGKQAPPTRTLNDWRKLFRETLGVLPQSRRPKTSPTKISEEKKQEVLTAMGDGTCSSQREASNAFRISVSSINRIVKSSPLKPYKYIMVQEFKETDPPKRLQFCNLVLSNQLENSRWSDRIFFSESK